MCEARDQHWAPFKFMVGVAEMRLKRTTGFAAHSTLSVRSPEHWSSMEGRLPGGGAKARP